VTLAPSRVQGIGAAEEIASAIRLLNEWSGCGDRSRVVDVILVTRGGGSLEDLWAFNEEIVARAIFDSRIPVVSAVGHEIDFTISDFVADFRAATPSAAAEILTEGAVSSRREIQETSEYLLQLAERQLRQQKERITALERRIVRLHPRRQLNERLQYLDDLRLSLMRCARQTLRHSLTRAQNLQFRFVRFRPSVVVAERKHQIADAHRSLRENARHLVEQRRNSIEQLNSRLRLLSPEHVLARGYSITTDAATGRVIRAAKDVKRAQRLKTRLAAGQIESDVVDGSGKK